MDNYGIFVFKEKSEPSQDIHLGYYIYNNEEYNKLSDIVKGLFNNTKDFYGNIDEINNNEEYRIKILKEYTTIYSPGLDHSSTNSQEPKSTQNNNCSQSEVNEIINNDETFNNLFIKKYYENIYNF